MTSPEWWPDELDHAGGEHLDPNYVAGYDDKAQVDPVPDVALLAKRGMGPGSHVVDLGAGTGAFAFAAAATGADVIAVDVSTAMCEYMQARTEREDVPNVDVVQAGFLSFEQPAGSVDFVYSRNALHQLPDFWKVVAIERIAAMLRPGGTFRVLDLVFDLDPFEIAAGIEAWMAGAVEDPAVGYTAPEFAEHVRIEHSTFTWLFEPMLERCGFDIVDRTVHRNVYAAYTCQDTR